MKIAKQQTNEIKELKMIPIDELSVIIEFVSAE